jgi:cell division septation protein DedD
VPTQEPSHSLGPRFSVPLISELEKGKCYLQLGAFTRPESVESALSRIGQTYPLTVQAAGNPEQPLYRVLLGPVNLGESGALLQRFKGNGYQDAFIRQDG